MIEKIEKLELLDYILDYDDNFWIVSCIDNKIKGYIVYKVDDKGNRYNNITQKYYKKMACEDIEELPNYKKIFKPNKHYLEIKESITGVWKKYIDVLNEIGIEDKDIGTIGIIGPKRMNYSKIISVMKFISKKLNDDFKNGKL